MKSKLTTIALVIFSVWVPLVGAILWYRCKRGGDVNSSKLFAVCAIVGFVINCVPILMNLN